MLSENRLIGRTGKGGYFLVPDLVGWQRNRIGIQMESLAFDETVGQTERIVIPADRSGAIIRFDVRQIRSALVSLLGPDGEPVAAGTTGQITESGESVIVGFGGEIYLEDLSTPRTVQIIVEGTPCRYTIPAVPEQEAGGVARIGPLACEEGPR